MAGKFEIYKGGGKTGGYRWRLKSRNGEIVASGEAYETKAGAKKGRRCGAAGRSRRQGRGPDSRLVTNALRRRSAEGVLLSGSPDRPRGLSVSLGPDLRRAHGPTRGWPSSHLGSRRRPPAPSRGISERGHHQGSPAVG